MSLRVDEFVALADKYQALGWAVQRQLKDILDGVDPKSKNPNALVMIEAFLIALDRAGIDTSEVQELVRR